MKMLDFRRNWFTYALFAFSFCLFVAIIYHEATDYLNRRNLRQGTVCQKDFVPAHMVGKAWIGDTWNIYINSDSVCSSNGKSARYPVSLENYASIKEGDRVRADDNNALFVIR